jgi:predicted MFS family arabinose efflux permease
MIRGTNGFVSRSRHFMNNTDFPKPQQQHPRRTLVLLMVLMAMAQLDRQILSITLEQIGTEFSLSDTQLGLLSGLVFALAFCLVGFPVAALVTRVSRRRIIAGSVLIWSGMTVLASTAQSFAVLLVARIGVGAGEAGSVAPAHSLISDLYPPERRTSAMSVFASGSNLGVLLAFLVGGVVGQIYGWRVAFLVAGVPGVILAIVLARSLPDLRPQKRPEADVFARTLGLIRQDSGLRFLLAAMAITGIVTFGGLSWTATFLIRSYGFSQLQTGLLMAGVVGIGGAAGTLFIGFLADRLGHRDQRWRLRLVALVIVFGKPLAFVFLLGPGGLIGMAAFVAGALFANAFWGPTFAYAHSRVPADCRPMITVILLFLFNLIGVGLGPTLVGILSDAWTTQSETGLGWGLAVAQALGVLGAWFYWRAAACAMSPQNET